jgi:Glycosyl hydrolase family 115
VGPAENFTGPTLINNSTLKTVIIAGTIGKSDVINALLVAQKFSELPIRGKWESYIAHVINNPFPGIDRALVIAGSDMRGTIYGLYDVSEQIGVSPWWDFADVPIKKSAGVWALEGRKTQRSPSVKYRGFFINDEQPALTNWIKYVSPKLCKTQTNISQ